MSFMSRCSMPAVLVSLIAVMSCSSTLQAQNGLTPQEERWLDARNSQVQQRVMNETIGHGLPEPVGLVEWKDEPLTWESLRGKVVLIQTWTRKSAAGRAAPRRLEMMLREIDSSQVQMIALHVPMGAEGLETYLEQREVGMPVLVDYDGFFCDDLGVDERPTTIAIDRSGAIRYPGLGLGGVRDAVASLLAEPFDASAPAPPPAPERDERDLLRQQPPTGRSRLPDFPPFSSDVGDARDIQGMQGPDLSGVHWMKRQPELAGKVVMVDLWATWCKPCRDSIPKLNRLAERYEGVFEVVGISREEREVVQGFLRKTPVSYTMALDPEGSVGDMIRNRTIPHALIMSPDGVVRWQGNPIVLHEDTVEHIIAASGLTRNGRAIGDDAHRWTSAPRPAPSGEAPSR